MALKVVFNPLTGQFDYVQGTSPLVVDSIQLNTAGVANPYIEGLVSWNPDDGTVNVGLPGGNVVNQVGQELLVPRRVKNDTGSGTVTNGKLLYISGGDGNNAYVKFADNTTEVASAHTIAMATETFTNYGYATTFGLVRDVNTAAYAPGTVLYLGTNGDYTSTKPVAPVHMVVIGQVFRQHATEGAILVNIQNGNELDELHDVLITSAVEGQILKRSGSLWVNSQLVKQDTEANILASTPSAGLISYGTDTQQAYIADGTNWRRMSMQFYTASSAPDMGYLQTSTKDGYYQDAITDKALSNVRILENALTQAGSVRTTTAGQFQVYLNSRWNNVVINFVLRENGSYGYTFEHQPIGFSRYIEVMSGNSLSDLGLNGLPLTQGYQTSMGAYPVQQTVDGGTF